MIRGRDFIPDRAEAGRPSAERWRDERRREVK
jgi:hypothetical protein